MYIVDSCYDRNYAYNIPRSLIKLRHLFIMFIHLYSKWIRANNKCSNNNNVYSICNVLHWHFKKGADRLEKSLLKHKNIPFTGHVTRINKYMYRYVMIIFQTSLCLALVSAFTLESRAAYVLTHSCQTNVLCFSFRTGMSINEIIWNKNGTFMLIRWARIKPNLAQEWWLWIHMYMEGFRAKHDISIFDVSR